MDFAIIDLGTNTFHLAVVKNSELTLKYSQGAKLGLGGMKDKVINDEAMTRGLNVLKSFKERVLESGIGTESVFAYGTSALRNAENADVFISLIKNELGIDIKVINGQEEADLIYQGVKKAVDVNGPSLIVDIGGGSVEFIICNENRSLWKQSFEIGGLRLMEKFMPSDTISPAAIGKMNDFFTEKLLDLHNAIHQYRPKTLIGSSGSFDTLNDLYYQKKYQIWPPKDQAGFAYPIEEFYWAYEQLVPENRAKRLSIPGMIELRVDMIVVAMVLIAYLIRSFDLQELKISNYALLEGAVFKKLAENA
jgi:exopolyphosphatase / guanosine-5'-triphosphate,3'-diphosphate pyrophosphatase